MSDDLYILAPAGCLYVCRACGKTSKSRAGFDPQTGRNLPDTTRGWDESCTMNSVLCLMQKDEQGCWIAAPEELQG